MTRREHLVEDLVHENARIQTLTLEARQVGDLDAVRSLEQAGMLVASAIGSLAKRRSA